MVLLCLAVGFAGTRLGLCWVLLEERWPEYRTPCRRPYPAIALRALGNTKHCVAVVAQTLTLMGVSTVVPILAGDLLASQAAPLLIPCAFTGVVACLLTPVSWLATPKDFCLYLPVSGVGYGLLKDAVPSNILLAVSGVAVTVVQVLLFVHLFAFIILPTPVAQRSQWHPGPHNGEA